MCPDSPITCGTRAERFKLGYRYRVKADCHAVHHRGPVIRTVGVNKSAEQFQILDERTREEMAAGAYHDQRRATYGAVPAASGESRVVASGPRRSGAAPPRRNPWTLKQQRRALLYNEQGVRPEEIAQRLGVSRYLVTQMILAGRNRTKG